MPILTANVVERELEGTMMSTQTSRMIWEIKNSGNVPVHDIFVCLSHPGWFSFQDMTVPPSHPGPFTISNNLFHTKLQRVLPKGLHLKPGESHHKVVYMRPEKTGRHIFRFVFAYKELDDVRSQTRLLRASFQMDALPLFKVNLFSKPTALGTHDHVVGLEVGSPFER